MTTSITFDKAHLNFPAAVKKIRAKKGITQGDIFRRTGLERSYVSRIENGLIDDPRLTTVVVLARALEISVDDLIKEAMKAAVEEDKAGHLPKKK